MIRARLLRIDEAPRNLDGDTWTTVAPDDQNLLWLDLEDGSADEFALAASKFVIAAPALEALRSVNRRPKVRVYKDYFVVTTLAVDVKEVERDSPRIEIVKTEVLVGTNFLLTSHARPWPQPFVEELEQRVSTNPYLGRLHAAYLLYVLLDTVVGNYAREFDEVEDRVERLEEQLLRDPGRKALDQATLMKRHVISLRRLVAPNREAFGVLGAADIPQIDQEHVQPYFHDLLEHIDDFVDRLEVFSPDYLLREARPVITDAPASITYGQGFPIHLVEQGDLSSVSFIRLSAVTHCFNMGQRFVALDFAPGDPDGFEITAPADANLAPPGYYMLFVMDGNGVPAVAPIIQLVAV